VLVTNVPYRSTGETTMTIRTQLRTLATASLLALTVISLPGAQAYAAPNTNPRAADCRARGYLWSDSQGCADKQCSLWDGKSEPGDVVIWGAGTAFYCNGFTGTWEQIARSQVSTGVTSPVQSVPAR
jgi:hypothetical protein